MLSAAALSIETMMFMTPCVNRIFIKIMLSRPTVLPHPIQKKQYSARQEGLPIIEIKFVILSSAALTSYREDLKLRAIFMMNATSIHTHTRQQISDVIDSNLQYDKLIIQGHAQEEISQAVHGHYAGVMWSSSCLMINM